MHTVHAKNTFIKNLVLVTAERRKVDLDKKLKYLEIIVEHFFIIIILSFLICKKNRKQIDGQIHGRS